MGSFQSATRFEDVGGYTPEKVPVDVYLLRLAFSNVYLCDGVLIDAGTLLDFNSIRKALEAFQDQGPRKGFTLPLTAHAITHAHPDHQGSSHRVCTHYQIPYLCHELDKGVAEGTKRMSVGPSYHLMNYLPHNWWSGPPHPVDRPLRQGDRLGSTNRIQIIETPGHTNGSISFWIPDSRVIIIGDVLANQPRSRLPWPPPPIPPITSLLSPSPPSTSNDDDACPREPPRRFSHNCVMNRESLQKILELGPHIICFGHGPPLVMLNGPLKIMGAEKAVVGATAAAAVGVGMSTTTTTTKRSAKEEQRRGAG